ncbi:hypothetical protein C8R43DRAFT_1027504 [Mycena crocata]|nr:hypothetical protein C8R43DRAFT_1027504 [Mycena crocata]
MQSTRLTLAYRSRPAPSRRPHWTREHAPTPRLSRYEAWYEPSAPPFPSGAYGTYGRHSRTRTPAQQTRRTCETCPRRGFTRFTNAIYNYETCGGDGIYSPAPLAGNGSSIIHAGLVQQLLLRDSAPAAAAALSCDATSSPLLGSLSCCSHLSCAAHISLVLPTKLRTHFFLPFPSLLFVRLLPLPASMRRRRQQRQRSHALLDIFIPFPSLGSARPPSFS